jgi:hypothetical protein
MSRINDARGTFGKVKAHKYLDLPASSSDPVEIDFSDSAYDCCAQLSLRVEQKSFFVFSDSVANAVAAITAKNADIADAGRIALPIVGETNNLYVRRYDGDAVTDGLSYSFVEDTGIVRG